MKCPYCDSAVVKCGLRKTNLGNKQMHRCRACRKKFTPRWPRMRFERKYVFQAVDLYKKGMSTPKIKKKLEEEDICVSRWTIIKWHRKFG